MSLARSAARLSLAAAVISVLALVPETASAGNVTHVRDFVGTWKSEGNDLTKVVVAKDGQRITVKVWGSCGGESCLTAEFDAKRYATSVQDGSRGTVALSGVRTPSFATVAYLFTLRGGFLVFQQTYDYADDSRQDSYEEFLLRRSR